MFTHILAPTDGSALSARAASRAIELAQANKAKATFIMVSPTYRQLTDEGYLIRGTTADKRKWEASAAERARKVIDAATAEAKSAGIKCEAVHLFRDLPYQAIVDTATKNGCDLIVMGSHGYGGIKQWVLGSETTRVLSHSKVPVLVYR